MVSKFHFCSLGLCLVLVARLSLAAAPPTSVRLIIPDYVVSKVGELDEVTIPDGEILAEQCRPQVPYYIKKLDNPKGYRIQEVTLKERSGLKVDSGLKLPVVPIDTIVPSKAREGIWPLKDFVWNTFYNQDGTSTLFIYIYPFYYDPKTTKVQFYKNYEFDIRYVKTTLAIAGISVDKPTYDPGEKVKVELQLENSGKPQEVTVAASIYKVFTDEHVADLPAKSLKRLGKVDSVSLEWKTAGFPTGNYEVEAVIKDPAGNKLDRERTLFRLGNPQGEVTGFKATPQQFKIGDRIQFTLDFKNTGTCDLTGKCVFRIMKKGKVVDELKQNMALLKPGAAMMFQKSWSTEKAEKGAIYYVVGFVRYEGMASEPKSAMFSTNRFPKAQFIYTPEKPVVNEEITFDASNSTDADGKIVEFRWEFGDGGTSKSKETTHRYSLPGDYNVTLTITDNEGATDKIKETVSVGE